MLLVAIGLGIVFYLRSNGAAVHRDAEGKGGYLPGREDSHVQY
jgi:hypothetical protein